MYPNVHMKAKRWIYQHNARVTRTQAGAMDTPLMEEHVAADADVGAPPAELMEAVVAEAAVAPEEGEEDAVTRRHHLLMMLPLTVRAPKEALLKRPSSWRLYPR